MTTSTIEQALYELRRLSMGIGDDEEYERVNELAAQAREQFEGLQDAVNGIQLARLLTLLKQVRGLHSLQLFHDGSGSVLNINNTVVGEFNNIREAEDALKNLLDK